jgi:hypothetical protein
VTEQETVAVVTGAEAASEKIKELTERLDALVVKLNLSQETHDEERAVRLLAWKMEWDVMMREREVAIGAHRSATAANEALCAQAQFMIETRSVEIAGLNLHRLEMERIYSEGFKDIANALKAQP